MGGGTTTQKRSRSARKETPPAGASGVESLHLQDFDQSDLQSCDSVLGISQFSFETLHLRVVEGEVGHQRHIIALLPASYSGHANVQLSGDFGLRETIVFVVHKVLQGSGRGLRPSLGSDHAEVIDLLQAVDGGILALAFDCHFGRATVAVSHTDHFNGLT